jgi:hypothetical protein
MREVEAGSRGSTTPASPPVSSFGLIGTILPFSNRRQERKHFFLADLLSRFRPFFCSTAPQAFFRPDRRFPTPTRAEAVTAGPSLGHSGALRRFQAAP